MAVIDKSNLGISSSTPYILSPTENTKTYQQLLVKALHQCGVKFPITAEIVVPVLMDFLAEGNEVGTNCKTSTYFYMSYSWNCF